jgi:hypothetical protein
MLEVKPLKRNSRKFTVHLILAYTVDSTENEKLSKKICPARQYERKLSRLPRETRKEGTQNILRGRRVR